MIKATQISSADISILEKALMDENYFKSAGDIDNAVPDVSGIYCIRISDIGKLPNPFNTFLKDRQHDIIYIGIASESLNKRFLMQELRGKGHGTFFRSIGAMLGYRPPKGSLLSKKNKRNYKFAPADEQKIISWVNENLKVNWVEYAGDIETIETELINKYRPLINLSKNPSALQLLSDLRKACVQIANAPSDKYLKFDKNHRHTSCKQKIQSNTSSSSCSKTTPSTRCWGFRAFRVFNRPAAIPTNIKGKSTPWLPLRQRL